MFQHTSPFGCQERYVHRRFGFYFDSHFGTVRLAALCKTDGSFLHEKESREVGARGLRGAARGIC